MNEVSFELDLSRYFQVQSSTEQKVILLNKRFKKILVLHQQDRSFFDHTLIALKTL